jgi:hypothetical protein
LLPKVQASSYIPHLLSLVPSYMKNLTHSQVPVASNPRYAEIRMITV